MTADRFGLRAVTLEKIHGVFARHQEVEKAVIYGSRAKGNYKNGSDIDLTLYGRDLTPADLLAIMNDIDDLLLPYTFDLSIASDLRHPELIEHIGRVGIVFYEKQDCSRGQVVRERTNGTRP